MITRRALDNSFVLGKKSVLRITKRNNITTNAVPPIPAATVPGQGSIGA
jgi:hypothetical protein